ncbi:hypothetical protein [Burkholderia anthina]|nr:hypothetical protein [Burkholderia anthina]
MRDEIFSTRPDVTCLSGELRRGSARVRGAIAKYNRLVEPDGKVF